MLYQLYYRVMFLSSFLGPIFGCNRWRTAHNPEVNQRQKADSGSSTTASKTRLSRIVPGTGIAFNPVN